jgi:hypothetical protein
MGCPTPGEGTREEAGPGPSGPMSGRSASLGPVASGFEAGWHTPHEFGRPAGSCYSPRLADQDRRSEGPLRPVVGCLHPLDAEEPQEMLPLLTQSPGETLIVPIREPSLLGDPGILPLRPEPFQFGQELLAISDRWTGWSWPSYDSLSRDAKGAAGGQGGRSEPSRHQAPYPRARAPRGDSL